VGEAVWRNPEGCKLNVRFCGSSDQNAHRYADSEGQVHKVPDGT
jgi:hypothetical protein